MFSEAISNRRSTDRPNSLLGSNKSIGQKSEWYMINNYTISSQYTQRYAMKPSCHSTALVLLTVANCAFASVYPPVGGLELIIGVIIVFGAFVVFISLAIPFIFTKGWWRLILPILILVFWGYLFNEKLYKNYSENSWRQAGIERCELEAKELPNYIIADELLDEGSHVSIGTILRLLSERHLKFVEIHLPVSNTENSITLPPPPAANLAYARLALGKMGSENCITSLGELEHEIHEYPFLPETCLTVEYLTQPTARYSIHFEREADIKLKTYGQWLIFDRFNHTRFAQLTTTETENTFYAGGLLDKNQVTEFNHCTAPHAVILNRFLGKSYMEGRAASPQVVVNKSVKATMEMNTIYLQDKQLPLIAADVSEIHYDQPEENLRSVQVDWRSAIEGAARQGVSSYNSKLLFFPERELVSFKLSDNDTESAWSVFTINRGFLVARATPSWHETRDNIIAHFDKSGKYMWATRIKTPKPIPSTCTEFKPRNIYISSGNLVLTEMCGTLKWETWSIPLKSLPGPL